MHLCTCQKERCCGAAGSAVQIDETQNEEMSTQHLYIRQGGHSWPSAWEGRRGSSGTGGPKMELGASNMKPEKGSRQNTQVFSRAVISLLPAADEIQQNQLCIR